MIKYILREVNLDVRIGKQTSGQQCGIFGFLANMLQEGFGLSSSPRLRGRALTQSYSSANRPQQAKIIKGRSFRGSKQSDAHYGARYKP